MIKAVNVTRSFGRKRVLADVNFETDIGALIEIRGKNGAGKTTWLKLLSGLIPPSAGQITIDGLNTSDNSDKIKEVLSFASATDQGFFPRLNGQKNLEFFCAFHNFLEKEVSAKIETLKHFLPLHDCLVTPYCEMSTGMRQLLKLTYLFCLDKKIWLLDEPLRSLDSSTRQGILAIIKKTRDRKVIIYTNHSDYEWETLKPRRIILENKNLKPFDQSGSHEKLFELL